MISPHVFLLDEDAASAGPDILVLVPTPSRAVSQGADVMVTGIVRAFVAADLERDADWFDADGMDVDFTDRTVIVAQSVKASDVRELAGVIARVPAARTASAAPPATITAGQLADNAGRYIGQRVRIRAEIDDVAGRGLVRWRRVISIPKMRPSPS
jgi:hypothetical protein